MHEVIHMLGLCGEKHASLIAIISEWQSVSHIFNYIKTIFK